MGRPAAAAFAVLLVVSALVGCSGLSGPADEPRTVNPDLASTPSPTPSPTPTPDYPPGVSANDVDVGALATAHDAALDDVPVTVRWNTTLVAANGTTLAASRSVIRSHGPRLRYRFVAIDRLAGDGGTRWVLAFWTDGERTVVRRVATNGTATLTATRGGPPAFAPTDDTGEGTLYPALAGWNLGVAGRERRGNGTVTVLRGNDPTPDLLDWGDARGGSAQVLVTDEGVVRSYTLTYEVTVRGVNATRTETFRVTGVGNTTAPRPPWYDRATGNGTGTAGASRNATRPRIATASRAGSADA